MNMHKNARLMPLGRERLIRMMLSGQTPAAAARAADLPLWTHLYNWHRPHGGIRDQTPISRLGINRDNLLTHHI